MPQANQFTYITRDGTPVLLTEGELDDAGRRALSNGLCLEWAIARARRQGGVVAVVCDSFNGDLEDDDCPIDRGMRHGLHAVILQGATVEDIEGRHTLNQAYNWYGPGTYLLELTPVQANALARTETWTCEPHVRAWVTQLAASQATQLVPA